MKHLLKVVLLAMLAMAMFTAGCLQVERKGESEPQFEAQTDEGSVQIN